MVEPVAPTSIAKPDIVVPDTAPLIHLGAAGLLHLLYEVGGVVIVVDMVAIEITRDAAKPGATVLQDWMARGSLPGSNAPVRVEETETGRLYAAVLPSQPEYKLRNGGETAIIDWLAETVAGTDKAVIVLYENGRAPSIVRDQNLDTDIDVLTTRACVEAMKRRRSDPGGPTYWERIEAAEPTTNPRIPSFSQPARRPDFPQPRAISAVISWRSRFRSRSRSTSSWISPAR